ncbi:MAG: endonuclease MutS2, partial [Chloroflexota bacterium]
MDEKTLAILEFPKILERLAGYCAFSASQEMALALRPSTDLFEVRRRQQVTSEAVQFLVTHSDVSIGGTRDVRPQVDLAQHGAVLSPTELLDIKQTLVSARTLARTFERAAEQYPALFDIVAQLAPPVGLVDAVTRTISERGDVLDSASEKLASVRRELRVVHERLMAKLQRMVGDPHNAPYLQEAIITQREGRYVIPLRAEFKGRIRAIIHDQSQSGATLFVEPLNVVEQNNQYRELQLAERDEERRILTELSRQVAINGEAIIHTVDVIAALDLALAQARYAEDLLAVEPGLAELPELGKPLPKNGHPGSVIRLYQARHPLLDQAKVVSIDVELDPETYALIITGPNTGGKTVALKTVGLLALMAQAGMHIPAHSGSEISVFEAIYADIGDEQSIEQSLSTFSGHITNIIRILEQADRRSLVILDELGAGTDPQEGSALARAILSHLLKRSITTLVTTHHPELKAFAHATPGVVNASVEFDLETLRPTYRLTIG